MVVGMATRERLIPLALALGAVTLAGCGDDGDGAAPAASEQLDGGVLAVEMADFHYGDLPAEVPVGTELAVSNVSESEIHEFVAFRLDDDEERPADEIVAGDLGALLGGSEPAMVLLATPGSDEQIVAVGEPTFSEPGRYLIVCVIPTGADPGEYLAAAAESDGPPQVDGGPPHVANGMFAEITVTS